MAREQSERRFIGLPVPVTVTIDPWETDLADRRQQALLLDWRTKVVRDASQRTQLPHLESIDSRIIAALGDTITVLDVLEGGDFRFRSIAKGAIDLINRNIAGVKLSDLPPQMASLLRQAYAIVLESGFPVFTRHVWRGGKADGQRWQRLCLPMRTSTSGDRIGAIVVQTLVDLAPKSPNATNNRSTWKQGDPIWDV